MPPLYLWDDPRVFVVYSKSLTPEFIFWWFVKGFMSNYFGLLFIIGSMCDFCISIILTSWDD